MDLITKNDIAKYQVTVNDIRFSFTDNTFNLTLRWGMMGESLAVTKDDLLHDDDGNYYFFFSTADMYGTIVAECQFGITDTDFTDGEWLRTDTRHLCRIVTLSCCSSSCDCECDGNDGLVSYAVYDEATTEPIVLMDVNGNIITDVNSYILTVNS